MILPNDAQLISAAPDMLAALEEVYSFFGAFHNNWKGRDTLAGQHLLCKMRDAISKATNRDSKTVQDDYANRSAT
jgi:hypothetical protein